MTRLLARLTVTAAAVGVAVVFAAYVPGQAVPGQLAERVTVPGPSGGSAAATPPATRKDAGAARSASGHSVAYWRYWARSNGRRARREHAEKMALLRRLRQTRTVQASALPAHYSAWLCIYRGENGGYGWTANTGNGYYGGLQADMEFQRTYAPDLLAAKGTADHWTPLEQMWMAERAWASRGFWPWPRTARNCGLLP